MGQGTVREPSLISATAAVYVMLSGPPQITYSSLTLLPTKMYHQDASGALSSLSSQSLIWVAVAICLSLVGSFWPTKPKPLPGIPIERGPKLSEKQNNKDEIFALVKAGLIKGHPFQIMLNTGPRVILPYKFMNEIRNDARFDIDEATNSLFFVRWPVFRSFGAFTDGHVMLGMVTKKLTTSLASITGLVNEESSIAVPKIWPPTVEWEESRLIPDLLQLTTQVTSRIFLGLPTRRDPELLRVMRVYTTELSLAAQSMRMKPLWLRPFAYLFDPQVKALSKTVRTAYSKIGPELQHRQKKSAEAISKGQPILKRLDSINWFEEIASIEGRKFDVVAGQLSLSFAAIHTTSLTTAYTLFDIISHPELVRELRQEIIDVLKEDGGWRKTTLYKLKLLDAVMKESQRLTPIGFLMVCRVTTEKVTLSDGHVIPKGVQVNVPNIHMQEDGTIYPKPQQFDAKRFLKLREQPGAESKHQFVTTSELHMAFGHGKHACPGRFFASNEIKLILAHLLMNYDWELKDGIRPRTWTTGINRVVGPTAQVLYRSRQSEVSFD
ncbi:hypothetical protein FDECE_10226 [Fusarium decemcellulare]|nr:hypothetical protein FDECE_10226 [Fusarium decemcellulare]